MTTAYRTGLIDHLGTTSMKLSLVLPCYSGHSTLESLAIRAVQSYRDQVDELIVIEDGGRFSTILLNLSDIYVRSAANQGFTVTANRGWKLATGDYVIIANSDTWLTDGNLRDFCIPGKVVTPSCLPDNPPRGAFFVVPKSVSEEHGILDESMRHYYSDTDYFRRVRSLLMTQTGPEIRHDGAASYEARYADPHNECSKADAATYLAKWGSMEW